MQQLFQMLDKLADTESPVLIQGENGTGKELVARAIHAHSPRRDAAFVSQNCSAFNDNLLDSELFGHVKGAFTGAFRDKKGLFEVADRGTFFMDEIGDMSPVLQVKLLRVLQEGIILPVGGVTPKKVDVRVITATNRNLRGLVKEGDFREDLFYRINVLNIQVPALRERREDIPILADHFLLEHARRRHDRKKMISPDAVDALMAYDWPGNVRQLENEVQRAIVLSGLNEVIGRDFLSVPILGDASTVAGVNLGGSLRQATEQLERRMLVEGLRRLEGNRSKLAREMGISRTTLLGKLDKYGLSSRSAS